MAANVSRTGPPSMALAANLPASPRVIPDDQHPTSRKGNVMSRTTIKAPLATLAVVAGLLAAAGPVSASAQALSSSAPIDPTRESFSIDIGTSEKIAATGDRQPRPPSNGIIAILIG
jgi:hypothetical protein